MMKRWLGLVVIVLAMLLVAGCSSKKKSDGLADGEDQGSLSDESLSNDAGRGGGSLALAQRGQAGAAGDTGPLHDIRFDYDSFELDEGARQTLQENGEWLKDHPNVRVEIEGHCDDRGTVEYNLALGAKRAAAAKNYLVTLGIARDRLTTISYGEELPLCHEATESCWSENRRAHFVATGS